MQEQDPTDKRHWRQILEESYTLALWIARENCPKIWMLKYANDITISFPIGAYFETALAEVKNLENWVAFEFLKDMRNTFASKNF